MIDTIVIGIHTDADAIDIGRFFVKMRETGVERDNVYDREDRLDLQESEYGAGSNGHHTSHTASMHQC